MGDSVDFPKLKKAISGLKKLEYLALPSSMSLTRTNESVGQWPQLLTELRVGGRVDYDLLLTYCWPQNLETLSFSKCIDLNTFQLGAVVANEQIKQGLKKLIIGLDNYGLAADILRPAHEIGFHETFWSMEKLLYLKIPADFAFKFFETVDEVTAYASLVTPLRALEITSSLDNEWMHDSHFSILLYNMICLPFQNVWSLVVWKDIWSVLQDREYHHGQLIEDEIWLHVPEEDDPYLNSPEFASFESMHPLGLSLGVETIEDHVY